MMQCTCATGSGSLGANQNLEACLLKCIARVFAAGCTAAAHGAFLAMIYHKAAAKSTEILLPSNPTHQYIPYARTPYPYRVKYARAHRHPSLHYQPIRLIAPRKEVYMGKLSTGFNSCGFFANPGWQHVL